MSFLHDPSHAMASVPNSTLESPFLSQIETVDVGDTPPSADEHESDFASAMFLESPFPSVYEMETDSRTIDPHDEEILEFLDELYDDEFDAAIVELLTAAETLYQDRLSHEYGDVVSKRIALQRQFEAYTHPAVRALEGFLDELSHELEQHDLDRMTVQDINHLVDQFDTPQTPVPPEFEQFIGKAKKKAKAAVKRAVNTAKQQATSAVKKGAQAARAAGKAALKGAKALTGAAAIQQALKRLRRLVPPLLKQVLNQAINRLPAQYRPVAQQLKTQLFRSKRLSGKSRQQAVDWRFSKAIWLSVILRSSKRIDAR